MVGSLKPLLGAAYWCPQTTSFSLTCPIDTGGYWALMATMSVNIYFLSWLNNLGSNSTWFKVSTVDSTPTMVPIRAQWQPRPSNLHLWVCLAMFYRLFADSNYAHFHFGCKNYQKIAMDVDRVEQLCFVFVMIRCMISILTRLWCLNT